MNTQPFVPARTPEPASLAKEIAEELVKNFETAYMTGAGTDGPLGLFTASADGITTARDVSTGNTATEMKFDGLPALLDQMKADCEKAREILAS